MLFFVVGVIKTCGSFTELKKPEVAVKCFIRFVLAQAAVTYCMDLMTAIFTIAQGAISSIIGASGLSAVTEAALPESMVSTIENVGFFESIQNSQRTGQCWPDPQKNPRSGKADQNLRHGAYAR